MIIFTEEEWRVLWWLQMGTRDFSGSERQILDGLEERGIIYGRSFCDPNFFANNAYRIVG